MKQSQGFTLIETLVALFVLSFAFTGPLTLAWFSIRSASSSQNQFVASYLTEEALEYVKNVRDNNALKGLYWLDRLAPVGPGNGLCRNPAGGCYVDPVRADSEPQSIGMCAPNCPKLRYDSATGLYCYDSGGLPSPCDSSDQETLFIRRINLTRISDYEERIKVTISWQERFGPKSFAIEENIFDWP